MSIFLFLYVNIIHAQTTWTGMNGTSWTDASNWTAGVPDASDDVTIPDVTNGPVISTAALAKSVEVQVGGVLTISAMASLTMNGSKTYGAATTICFYNEGTVENSGQLVLGNMSGTGQYGLYNLSATFTNKSGGEIHIDRASNTGLRNEAATFTNDGKITIGANSVMPMGLQTENSPLFLNNATGEIKIDNTSGAANVEDFGVSKNYGKITIGTNSSGTLTQLVNNMTTVNVSTFCNTGSITLNDGGTGGITGTAATPYPSNMVVSGLFGTIQSITVDLKGVVHLKSRDIDLLLVAPTGQKFLMMTGVGDGIRDGFTGPTFIPIPSNLTLSDAAVSALPRSSVISSGTYRPTSYEWWANTFPAPAPAPTPLPTDPYTQAAPVGSATFASVFNGLNPNGNWELFATDDTSGTAGIIANGWCLNFTISCTNPIAYVNAAVVSSGDGTTWATAFKTLQEALTAANACPSITQIWVAKDTYYPTADAAGATSPADARTKTFVMKNNLAIYGGFSGNGTETMLSERNWSANPTILSGEIQQDNDASNNCYHVIRNYNTFLTSTAVLDGFTITGGNMPYNIGGSWGGGMLNFESSPSLSNITFSGNSAKFGGGMFNHNSTPSLSNVTFSGNSAEFGGGMFNEASIASASLTNVTFLGNSAITDGGGMYNVTSSPILTNCSLLGNQASDGGGMYNFSSSPILTNCIFSGNQANNGGGMLSASSAPILTNCSFSGNQANNGGGMLNTSANPLVSPSLKNCILWGNSSEVGNFSNSNPTYTNCLVQGLNPAGTGNLDGTNAANNPLFVNQPTVGLGTTGNLTLQACSPAIDAGTSTGAPTTDILGNARVDAIPGGNIVDMGAYEYQSILQEINLQGGSPLIDIPDGDISPTVAKRTDFGSIFIGGTLTVPGFKIENKGTLPLSISAITALGGDAGMFNPNLSDWTVAAGSFVSFSISFTPTSSGLKSTTIHISNSDCDEADYDFVVQASGICEVPAITAPTVTQPTCTTPTGTIVVNATGSGTLEYSINNGGTWQSNNTYSGQAPGNYNIKVRLQANPTCEATYASNPVVLNSPFTASTTTDTWTGCISTDWATQGNWADGSVPTAADDAVIPNTTNKPTIFGGTVAVAKSIEVQSGTTLTIAATASLTVNGSKSISGNTIALFNGGTVTNSGQVAIGSSSMADVGKYGIRNEGTFTNSTGGNIQIDRWTDTGLYNEAGSFTNSGNIIIGASAATGKDGLFNRVIFSNTGSGLIQIDRSFSAGISNLFSATFTNSASITIGSLASVGTWGLLNQATFNNNTGGDIKIDNATGTGLYSSNSFTNVAKITIGATASIGGEGIDNRGTFNNNTGGDIKIDRTGRGLLNHTATFNNAALITIGASASVGQRGLNNFGATAMFNNNTGGEIKIDNATAIGLYNESGTFTNVAKIIIGSNAGVGGEGINIAGNTFNNKPGGSIQIDRTGSHALRLLNSGTVFNNESIIEIGSQADVRGSGIRNGSGCTFNNMAGGDIYINRIGIYDTGGISCISNFGTFTNNEEITVGNGVLLYGQDGIFNAGSFTNGASGVISIEKPWGNGIWNSSGTFQNAGQITISNIFYFEDGEFSTGILSTAPFSNQAGAEIYLDQVGTGIASTRVFTNAGLIRMGENGALTGSGIANVQGVNAMFNNNAGGDISIKQTAVDGIQNEVNSTFNNNTCAKLTIFDNINNAGAFTNAGLFTVNTAQAHTNSALNNNGIITYPVGNQIPNVTNNEIIIAPTTANACDVISPAFGLGSPVDFTILGIFNDAAATMSAGTYVMATNTFTPTSVLPVGTYTYYVKIEDINEGCTSVVLWKLTTQDITPPGITCPTTQTLVLGANCTTTLPNYTSLATTGDNCGVQSLTQSPIAGTVVSGAGNMTVTLTVTDNNGLTNSCTFTITKEDNTAPTITCPTTQSLVLGANCTAALPNYTSLAAYGDNCGVQSVTQSPIAGTVVSGAGNMTVILTVTDVNGLTNSCTFTVTKADQTPPTISNCPNNQNVLRNASCTAILPNYTGFPITGDNCSGGITVSQMPAPGTVINSTITVTLTAMDANGNMAMCSFTATPVDQTPPTIACPATQTLALGANCTATLPNYTMLATAGDNCGVQSVTQSPAAGTTFSGSGNMTVTLTVTDVNGLTNSCTFTVIKVDNTAPTSTCPATQTLVLGANCTAALPNYTSLVASGDNCGVQSVMQSPIVGTVVSGTGNMTVILTVTDMNGLTNTCTFTVTKLDNTPPGITCPAKQTLVLGANCTGALPNYTSLAITGDNCGVQGVTQSPTIGTTVFGAGDMTVTLKVTDVNGMTNNCTFTVTKVDNTPPTVICSNQTVNFNGQSSITLDANTLVSASDNCGVQSTLLSPNSINSTQVGQNALVMVTVTDVNNNTATCTSNITVSGLPAGWSAEPNGVGCNNGNNVSYSFNMQVFTATSTNCYYPNSFTSDALAFAQYDLCGNGSITAQITSITGRLGWAGVTMRESNAAGAKKAQLMTNLSTQSRREFRATTNGQAYPQQFASQNRYWLRITRTGNQFVMSISPNGTTWYPAGAQNITMSSCIEMGLVVTNYTANSTVTANFANVSVTGGNITRPAINSQEDILTVADFSILPNPTSGLIELDLSSYHQRKVQMELYNLQGKLLRSAVINAAKEREEIDLSTFANGMYLIRVRSERLPDVTKRVVVNSNR